MGQREDIVFLGPIEVHKFECQKSGCQFYYVGIDPMMRLFAVLGGDQLRSTKTTCWANICSFGRR